jgi:organic radical activating enzyme
MNEFAVMYETNENSRYWKIKMDESGEYKVAAYLNLCMDAASPKTVDGIPVIDYEQFCAFYAEGVMKKIIIPREQLWGHTQLISFLKMINVKDEDIILTDRATAGSGTAEYNKAPYLPYLEFHTVDQCNLNCKGCEHYSGLVRESKIHDVDGLYRDLLQLKKFISDIGVIRIMGGEPLLHPRIDEIISNTRKVYPDSQIHVVTNGFLIRSMKQSFFDAMKNNDARLWISYYPEIAGQEDGIKQILTDNGIKFQFGEMATEFRIKYTLQPNDDVQSIFLRCYQSHCNNLYEGKVGACCLPFTTKYFNRYFDKNIPEDGAIDLYDGDMTTQKLKERLMQPFERCRYCMDKGKDVPWKRISNPSTLSDWIYECQDE